MDTAITTIYCLSDDFIKAQGHREDPQCTLSDAEIVTVAITAARFFGANFETAMTFLRGQGYLQRPPRDCLVSQAVGEHEGFLPP